MKLRIGTIVLALVMILELCSSSAMVYAGDLEAAEEISFAIEAEAIQEELPAAEESGVSEWDESGMPAVEEPAQPEAEPNLPEASHPDNASEPNLPEASDLDNVTASNLPETSDDNNGAGPDNTADPFASTQPAADPADAASIWEDQASAAVDAIDLEAALLENAADETNSTGQEIIAETITGTAGGQSIITGETDGQSSEDLFAQYVDNAFGIGKASAKLRKKSTAGSKLTGINSAFYSYIASELPAIAAGERSSTVFEISVEDCGLEKTFWTADELGVESILVENENGGIEVSSDAINAALSEAGWYLPTVVSALLADYPYHLYWYDKTQETFDSGFGFAAYYNVSIGDYIIAISGTISASFPVAAEYSAGEYTVNTAIGQSVQTAAANALAIVDDHSSETDLEKLNAYREEICSLASYNFEAAAGGVSYGNPWQMIWVFDKDPDTKVVCEGYAKAFKYLCDQSSFIGDISCITVTGTMTGGTGAGAHMWNIVNMEDGNNYLVDVTNCDEGTIGEPDLLFLSGAVQEAEYQYLCTCGSEKIRYTYDAETIELYQDTQLILSASQYQENDTAIEFYYVEDYTVPSDPEQFSVYGSLAPLCIDAIQRGKQGIAISVDPETAASIQTFLDQTFTYWSSEEYVGQYLFDIYMQEYPEIADKYAGLTDESVYEDGYLFIPFLLYERNEAPTPISIYIDGSALGDYTTLGQALLACEEAVGSNLTIMINDKSSYMLLPGDMLPSGIETIAVKGADIEEDGFFTTPKILICDHLVLNSDLELFGLSIDGITPYTINTGNYTLRMDGKVTLGRLNISNNITDLNSDTGSGALLSIIGSGNSMIEVSSSNNEIIGSINVNCIAIDDGILVLRGGGTVVSASVLKACEGQAELYVGVTESADSVTVNIDTVSIGDDAALLFSIPASQQQLTVKDILPTQGQMSIHTAALSDEAFSGSDIEILSEYIPAGRLFSYQINTQKSFEETGEYIPEFTRLMKIPYLDVATQEITVDIYSNQETESLYVQLQFAVDIDNDGYAVRGKNVTREWIGDYYVIRNNDETYHIIGQTGDTQNAENIVLPDKINDIAVTGVGTDYPYFYEQVLLNPSNPKVGRWNTGHFIIPASYNYLAGISLAEKDFVVFLGEKPEFDLNTVVFGSKILYLSKYADSWAPNGETSFNETELVRLECIDETTASVEATCVSEGYTIRYSDFEDISVSVTPAAGHTKVIDKAAVAATCTESGLTEGSHCSVCGEIITEQEVVPAAGHKEITDPAVAATCTESGLTEGSHCSVCSEVITEQEVIPATGHHYINNVCENCGDIIDGFAKVDGTWGWYKDNKLQTSMTGVVKGTINGTQTWYYISKGIYTKASGIAKCADGSNSTWYYVKNGVYTKATGIAKRADGSSNTWYYVKNGVYTKATGIAKRADGSNSTWYYVKNGVFTKATCIARKADGSSSVRYYVKNGIFNKYTGTVTISGKKYKLVKGVVK